MISFDILVVFGLLLVAIVLFATEYVSFDITALILTGILLVTGILTPEEGLSGFSNPATITIGCMFVLSEGLRRTGLLDRVGDYFTQLGKKNFYVALVAMMLIIAVISAFINNTAAVAIFIPVIIGVAADLDVSPSKMLMPLSFASMFGGVCTLIGTSTNILVSSILQDHGMEPLSMFEFTPLGLIFLIAGFIYLFTMGLPLIPERRNTDDLTSQYQLQEFLTDVIVEPEFDYVGHQLDEAELTRNLDLDVLRIMKKETGKKSESVQRIQNVLEPGDVLRIRGAAEEINKLLKREDLSLRPAKEWHDVDLEIGRDTLLEVILSPDTDLENKRIRDVDFFDRFGAVPLAVRHHGELEHEDFGDRRISGGDSGLLALPKDRVLEVQQDPRFIVASEVSVESYLTEKMPLALGILAGVVLTASLNLMPIVVSALVGVVLMVLTGCLTPEEVYRAVNWKVIFLLAGVLPMGIAMDKTGAAGMLSSWVLDSVGFLGPAAVVSAFFLLSMVLTNIISNQATAALLAPIAIQAASSMGVNAEPMVLAVTYAASLSFMTPVGYQTNTMIYGPGQYRFTDFTKVGTPLNILFWIIATIALPFMFTL